MNANQAHGTGPGAIAPDGSAVEFYAAMSTDDKNAARVHAAVADGGSILDLGAGVGRVTHGLIALDHPVVAVDESAEMLAHIHGAEVVCSPIEDLDLGRTFDAVLLLSHLVEYGARDALLRACRRHVAPGGCVIVERLPPRVHAAMGPRCWVSRGVESRLFDVCHHGDGTVSATMEYRMGGRTWTHSFTSRILTDEELPGVLGAAGLRFDRFLDEDGAWILACPAPTA
jgi:SAM-dependent methyltransferase